MTYQGAAAVSGAGVRAAASERRKAWSYIRLSSAAQTKGHGKKRQMEDSAQYCLDHDLDLQEELYDKARSAFHGHNRKAGTAFHRFLTAIADGTVPPKSVLVVESLDRLDRRGVADALRNLLAILAQD